MARKLRVGLVQLRSGIDPAANRAAATPLLREAANAGARLIVTPECTTRLDRDSKRMLAAIRPEKEDPETSAWGKLAAELGVWVALGSTSVAAGDGRRAVNEPTRLSSNATFQAFFELVIISWARGINQ